MFWIFPKYWVKQDMNHESLPPKIKQKFQEVPKSKGMTSKYLIKYFNNSTQFQPACYLTFSSNMSDLNPFSFAKGFGYSWFPCAIDNVVIVLSKVNPRLDHTILSSNFFFWGGGGDDEKPCILTTLSYKSEPKSIT